MATTLAVFSSLESECTENRGLPDAQALLQLTAKLAQQANLSYCEIAPATSMLLCWTNWIPSKEGCPVFTHSTGVEGLLAHAFCLLHNSKVGALLATGFLGQRTVNDLHVALQTITAASLAPTN